MKLTAVVLTKNEEKNIESCLKHLSWCDDIIVVDDYSRDKTFDIAKHYTNKVFRRRFDNFSSQRNFGISKAKHNWILSIDPDEEVQNILKEEIIKAIKSTEFCAYYIPFKHHFFGKWLRHGGWYPSYLKRLFKKDKARWENDVHEILNVKGPVGYLKNPIIHYSHRDIRMFIKKMNKYTTFESFAMQRKGKKDNLVTMLFCSFKTFFNRYILQRGFLDGTHGFVVAWLLGFYVFIMRAKNWEIDYKNKNKWSFDK